MRFDLNICVAISYLHLYSYFVQRGAFFQRGAFSALCGSVQKDLCSFCDFAERWRQWWWWRQLHLQKEKDDEFQRILQVVQLVSNVRQAVSAILI